MAPSELNVGSVCYRNTFRAHARNLLVEIRQQACLTGIIAHFATSE